MAFSRPSIMELVGYGWFSTAPILLGQIGTKPVQTAFMGHCDLIGLIATRVPYVMGIHMSEMHHVYRKLKFKLYCLSRYAQGNGLFDEHFALHEDPELH